MNLHTPIGPNLSIETARQFAIDQVGEKVSAVPKAVSDFWEEVSGAVPPANPDITVFYSFLRFEGATFTLLEFVCGQTLQELCQSEDPSICEREIPLFSVLLDAYDGVTRATVNGPLPALKMELTGFGIARATASATPKLHGTMLIRQDGSWSEDILSEESGRSVVYPLLVAIYKELVGNLPKGAPLAPAQLTSFSKRSLTKEVTRISPRKLQYLTAAGACALLLVGLFAGGHFLAQRAASQRPGGLNLPQMPATPVVEAAPSPAAPSEPEPDVQPTKETLVINTAGMTRGPRLIRQIGPAYPALAKKQKISGVVKLDVTVAEDGSVYATRILSGDPLLAQSAASAVKKWVYQPALVNGKRKSSTTEVEIRFDLDDPR